MSDGFSDGQGVYVEIEGEQVEGVFVRPGEPEEGIMVETPGVDAPYKRDVAWVRRSDTGEVKAFLYEAISPR
jgi:hypothetical protein